MIISHGRKYIFVHIPKTGGTSLALALEAKAMKEDIMIGDTPKARQRRGRLQGIKTSGRLWKHSRLTDVYGLVDQARIESYFVFTLVRNPWDRMVSYYHWLQQQSFAHPAVTLAKAQSFVEFLKDPTTTEGLRNDTTEKYVCDQSGVAQCDLYLRLEDLAHDLPKLEAAIGCKLPPLARANTSPRSHAYQAYYTAQTQAHIADIFATDITRFGYSFD